MSPKFEITVGALIYSKHLNNPYIYFAQLSSKHRVNMHLPFFFFLSSNSTLQNLQHYISTSAFKHLTIRKAQQFLSKFPFIPIAPCQFRYLPQVISVRLHNSAHDCVPCKVLREGISYFRVKARHNLCHVHVLDVGTMHSWNCNLKMHIAHSRTSNQIRS